MNKGMIITLPNWDNVTEYLSQYSYEIIEEASKDDVKWKAIKGNDVTRDNFEKILKNLNFNFIEGLLYNYYGQVLLGNGSATL